jgi:hypothetical protein
MRILGLLFQNSCTYVGFEALTAVVLKSSALWDIAPCGPLKVNQPLEECIISVCLTCQLEWMNVCMRGRPSQPLHHDLQWSIVLCNNRYVPCLQL